MVFLFLELFHQGFNALFNREIFRRDIDGYVAVAAVKRSSLVKDVFERFVLVKDNAPCRDVCHPALNLVKRNVDIHHCADRFQVLHRVF